MRLPMLSAVALLFLTACYSTAPMPAPVPTPGERDSASSVVASDAGTRQRLDRWEREWESAKQDLATAREETVAAGRTLTPEVDAQVTDLLTREIVDGPSSEARIEDLEDAVSDALRLAQLVAEG